MIKRIVVLIVFAAFMGFVLMQTVALAEQTSDQLVAIPDVSGIKAFPKKHFPLVSFEVRSLGNGKDFKITSVDPIFEKFKEDQEHRGNQSIFFGTFSYADKGGMQVHQKHPTSEKKFLEAVDAYAQMFKRVLPKSMAVAVYWTSDRNVFIVAGPGDSRDKRLMDKLCKSFNLYTQSSST